MKKVRLKGDFIQGHILKNNMTIKEFAKQAGVNHVQFARCIRGIGRLGANSRNALQKYMKLSWDELFEIEE